MTLRRNVIAADELVGKVKVKLSELLESKSTHASNPSPPLSLLSLSIVSPLTVRRVAITPLLLLHLRRAAGSAAGEHAQAVRRQGRPNGHPGQTT